MEVLFKWAFHVGRNYLTDSSWIWDHTTDGCAKQYRRGNAIYLLSVWAQTYHVVIDRAVGAPGHGKDIVDGINATDKRFLQKQMCMIGTPECNDDKFRIEAASVIEDANASASFFILAHECARLCLHEDRLYGVKGHHKSSKRDEQAKLKERIYNVQEPDDVKFSNIKFRVQGFLKGEHNGLTAHYNIRVDPDLGIGNVALRRITCA